MAPTNLAPSIPVSQREIVAVEHPMIIKDIDKGLQTFGMPYDHFLYPEHYDEALPLYLRPGDPSCAPILSYNYASSNVVLKIMVPKRTGRKRKRGSQDPFVSCEGHNQMASDLGDAGSSELPVSSHSRSDLPSKIRRTLQDNVGKCEVEAIGIVTQTHKFRGLADFHYSTAHGPFMNKFRNTVMSGDYDKIKQFKLDPSRGPKPNDELIPPPSFSDQSIPFNWGYKQNAQTAVLVDSNTGERVLHNSAKHKKIFSQYISATDVTVPQAPHHPYTDNDPLTINMIAQMRVALEERPFWTRRALLNRLRHVEGQYLFKECLQYVGYQFRGGPWRDSIIKFGIDPRSEPKYRFYQTLFFKIYNDEDRKPGAAWHDVRSEYTRRAVLEGEDIDTHLFDGKTVHLDGKVWQICDVTDPICVQIAATSNLRTQVELDSDGWYQNGTMAKIRAVMRTRISSIQYGRVVPDEEFDEVLKFPDVVNDRKYMNVPVPDFRGSLEEQERWKKANANKPLPKKGTMGVSKKRLELIGNAQDVESEPQGSSDGKSDTAYSSAYGAAEQRASTMLGQQMGGFDSSASLVDPQLANYGPGGPMPIDPRVQLAMNMLVNQEGSNASGHRMGGPDGRGLGQEPESFEEDKTDEGYRISEADAESEVDYETELD